MAKRRTGNRKPKQKVLPGVPGKDFKKLELSAKVAEIKRDVGLLKQLFKDLDDYRDSQRDFLTDMMFSLNSISEVLTKRSGTLRFLANKELTDDSPMTYGQFKKMFTTIPVVSDVELMSTKAKIMAAYMEKRKRFRPLEYDGIVMEAHRWAKKLEVEYEEFEEFLSEEGVTLKDYIEMNGLENLVEDLSPEEEAVVKKNTVKAIKKIRADADAPKPKLVKPVEDMSDEELEEYLTDGGIDEPEAEAKEQPQAT